MVRVIINPVEGITIKSMPENWEEILKEINCDFFDVVHFYFKDDKDCTDYDFYVDDIGYYKNLEPSVLPTNYPVLVGTVVIGKSNSSGQDVSLSDLDIMKIISHIKMYHPDPEDETKTYYILGGTVR